MLVAAGFGLLTGDGKRGTRLHFSKDAVSKHSGLLQEHWGDRHIWNDEEVERAVRNGSECNKTVSNQTQKENASGCLVLC
jgi:hypothetical protein